MKERLMFISKFAKFSAVATLAIAVSAGLALALSKKSELPKGAKKLDQTTLAAQRIGKTIKGGWYKDNGKKGGNWSAKFTGGPSEGLKIQTANGKKRPAGKWTFKNGKFCSTQGSKQKMVCNRAIYKVGGLCYLFRSNGTKSADYKC